jgi:hypothetical protein
MEDADDVQPLLHGSELGLHHILGSNVKTFATLFFDLPIVVNRVERRDDVGAILHPAQQQAAAFIRVGSDAVRFDLLLYLLRNF